MKRFYRMITVSAILTLFLSFSHGIAADKKQYPTSPPSTIVKKCRIGYLEGGKYKDYQKSFVATINGLSDLGWIEKITIPEQEDKTDNSKIWAWLSANAKSSYLEFVGDAYYSSDFKKEARDENKKLVLKRLNEKKDIDLMIALGTWAGQDLANNDHSVSTIVLSVSDAIASKIVKTLYDSGYDHIYARLDPTRYERQVRAFHDVIGFKKLGVAFEDNEVGYSYVALGDIEKVAKERKFEIVTCCFKLTDRTKEEAESEAIRCANELAPKIDAFYITTGSGVTPKSLPKILEPMNTHKIPTFSQISSDEVRQGALLSIASLFKELGMFYAENIAKIINGAKPNELAMIYESPVKISFNAAGAMIIGLKPEIYNMLIKTAEEVYMEIETAK